MAQQPGNVLRALNSMLEDRGRRRRDEIDASLAGLQLSQQGYQFEQELAVKQKSQELALATFNEQKKQTFMASIAAVQAPIFEERNAAYNAGWNSVFSSYVKSFIESQDDAGIIYTGQKGQTNDLIKDLTKTLGTVEAAESVFGLIDGYQRSGGTDTASLILLVEKWEGLTKEPLGVFNLAKALNVQYNLLEKERRDIQLGDYDFNELQDYYTKEEIAEIERLRLAEEFKIKTAEGFVQNKEGEWVKKEETGPEPMDIDFTKMNPEELDAYFYAIDPFGKKKPYTGDAKNQKLGEVLEDVGVNIVGYDMDSKSFIFKDTDENNFEVFEDKKINITDTVEVKTQKKDAHASAIREVSNTNDSKIASLEAANVAGLQNDKVKNYEEGDAELWEGSDAQQENFLARERIRIENDALNLAFDTIKDEADEFRAMRRGKRAHGAFEGAGDFLHYFNPMHPARTMFPELHRKYSSFPGKEQQIKWHAEEQDLLALNPGGYRVTTKDGEIREDIGFGGRTFMGTMAGRITRVRDWFKQFSEDILDYEPIE